MPQATNLTSITKQLGQQILQFLHMMKNLMQQFFKDANLETTYLKKRICLEPHNLYPMQRIHYAFLWTTKS